MYEHVWVEIDGDNHLGLGYNHPTVLWLGTPIHTGHNPGRNYIFQSN